MHRDACRGTKIAMYLHRLLGIHVNVFHEPTRLVGPDGEQGQIDRSQPSSDLLEMGSITGIAREKDSLPHDFNQEPTPEGVIAVEHPPRRVVLRRCQRDGDVAPGRGLPPIELLHLANSHRAQQPPVADRGDKRGLEATVELAESVHITVIVVVMAEQHDRDGRQVVEADPRGPDPARSRRLARARSLGVHRIGKNGCAGGLNEKGRMTDERERDLLFRYDGWFLRLHGNRDRPTRPPCEEHARHRPQRRTIGAVRIEVAVPVEVVRHSVPRTFARWRYPRTSYPTTVTAGASARTTRHRAMLTPDSAAVTATATTAAVPISNHTWKALKRRTR